MSNFPLEKIMNNFAYDTDNVGSWFIIVVEINVQPLNK